MSGALLPRSKRTRTILSLLALSAVLAIPLAWENLQSLHLSTITGPFDVPTSSSLSPSTLTNNEVTFPRRPSATLPPSKARQLIDRLDSLRGIAFSPHYPFMQKYNLENVDRLVQYLGRIKAGEDIPPPRVVMSSWHFHSTCFDVTSSNGEVQWMRPILELMQHEDDMFIIYAAFDDGTFHKDFRRLGNDLVTHAWVDDEHVLWCFEDRNHCLQSPQNPHGVPLWKLFAFTFWGSLPRSGKWLPPTPEISWSLNPLGREWNIVPYRMPEGHFFIGYHYQGCQSVDYVPFANRPNQIVILAKKSSYFYDRRLAPDPSTFYKRLKNATGYEIITNAVVEDGYPIPEGLTSRGLLKSEEYDSLLANTKSLLGIGKPQISPTPYASLCRGVPVVLPYRSSAPPVGKNKTPDTCPARPPPSSYCGFYDDKHQHGPAAAIGEPWIYTYDVASHGEGVGGVDRERQMEDEVIRTVMRAVGTEIQPL
ncbi:hypothetical protein FB45DRAFT_56538 [Roridomyces roridus]|uniref:Uncharacterized protein n=1 Tax=Roridomyces roridus TaxID=1738132 RepID=A0AAD7BPC9_9AGAR|nr:hypothetical protein FB45DRAFT_56538 [Roridomyces roridus]